MRWVVDASVALKWVIMEDGRTEARRFLMANDDLISPEFLLVEVANALRTKVGRGQFVAERGAGALDAVQAAIAEFVPDRLLVADAYSLASRLQHSVYDCLYLACAARHDAAVVTADKRFADKLASHPERDRVHTLS